MVDAWVVSWRVQIGFKTSETVGAAWQSVRDLGCVPGAGVDLLQGPGGGGGNVASVCWMLLGLASQRSASLASAASDSMATLHQSEGCQSVGFDP